MFAPLLFASLSSRATVGISLSRTNLQVAQVEKALNAAQESLQQADRDSPEYWLNAMRVMSPPACAPHTHVAASSDIANWLVMYSVRCNYVGQ